MDESSEEENDQGAKGSNNHDSGGDRAMETVTDMNIKCNI